MTRWANLNKKQRKMLGIEKEQLKRKYNNKKPKIDGITFDSQKEADYYGKLKMLKQAGEVEKIELQPRFKLLDGFDDKQGNHHRPIHYYADFKVWWTNGKVEVIDVKGMKTRVYRMKKKMLLKKYPDINFREV
ncbi:MAG: DUF1064 domain-containing protein [Candidatus Woesearchaeota archaeon]